MRYAIVLVGLLAALPAAAETMCFDVVATQRAVLLVNRCNGRTWLLRNESGALYQWWPLAVNIEPWEGAVSTAPTVVPPINWAAVWLEIAPVPEH